MRLSAFYLTFNITMTTVFGGSSTSSTALCMGFLLPSVVEMTVGFGAAGFEMTDEFEGMSENS